LNSATICGIAVIFTRRAPMAPPMPPMSAPTMIHQYVTTRSSKSVAPIAIAMPTAATWFPERAVRGEESRFRPMMKSDAATR
jgi:hypothetical protein